MSKSIKWFKSYSYFTNNINFLRFFTQNKNYDSKRTGFVSKMTNFLLKYHIPNLAKNALKALSGHLNFKIFWGRTPKPPNEGHCFGIVCVHLLNFWIFCIRLDRRMFYDNFEDPSMQSKIILFSFYILFYILYLLDNCYHFKASSNIFIL